MVTKSSVENEYRLVVTGSSVESEYRSLASASAKLIWLQSLFAEIGVHCTTKPYHLV